MKIVFLSRPKNRKFEYKPRYYNLEREKREQRKKELGISIDENDKRSLLRGELQNRWRNNRKTDKEKTRRRTIIYLIMIVIVVYYIFFTDIIQKFVSLITSF